MKSKSIYCTCFVLSAILYLIIPFQSAYCQNEKQAKDLQKPSQGHLLIEKTDSRGILTQWSIYKGDSSKIRVETNSPEKHFSALFLILGPRESRAVFQIFARIKMVVKTPLADTLKEKRWEEEANAKLSVTKLPDETIDSIICKHFKVLQSDGSGYEMWTHEGLFGKELYQAAFVPEPGKVHPYLQRFVEQGVSGDPVKVIEKDKSGNVRSIFEFKAYQPGLQPDPLFLIPEGYKTLNLKKY